MAASKTKTPDASKARQAEVSRLLTRGYGVREIARELDISPASAQRWVNKVRAEIAAEYQRSIASLVELAGANIAELDAVKREAWAAYERSKKPARVLIQREEEGGDKGARTVIERRREQRLPDPRYLQTILKAQEQAARITGINAPEKLAPTTPDGKSEYGALTDSERASRIVALLDRARQARARDIDTDGSGAPSSSGDVDSGAGNDNGPAERAGDNPV